MLKLYFAPAACSLAPHLALQESGIPFELIRVDLKAKTYAGGDFKKINPKGSVPTLQLDNGEILTEAAVLLQYIADQKPGAGLLPSAGSWERYRAQEWLNFIATELHKGFGPLWKPTTPADYRETVLQLVRQKLDFVNNHFEKNLYLLGDRYSVVDCYLFTVINWSRYLKIDLSPWPHLQAFMTRVAERPATAQAMTAEGLNK